MEEGSGRRERTRRRSREARGKERKKKKGWLVDEALFFYPFFLLLCILKKSRTTPSIIPFAAFEKVLSFRQLQSSFIYDHLRGEGREGRKAIFFFVKCEILFMAKRVEVSRRFFLRLLLLFFS